VGWRWGGVVLGAFAVWTSTTGHTKPIAFRSLLLEADIRARRLTIGDHDAALLDPALSATIAHGRAWLEPSLGNAELPDRWSIALEHLDESGRVLDRLMPIVGYGLPPIAVEVLERRAAACSVRRSR
jgi:hypothetical protein